MYVCMCTPFVQCLKMPEEGIRSPGNKVRDSCEPLCLSWGAGGESRYTMTAGSVF